ncbi:5-oxoprolinase subunit PxpB [Rhizobium sp. NFR12]|uniref:5-oxoprolinase subunit PxpB n=1 Tax=Rhizobium sp. NFR12 TaxID=1566261 RepID=UPI0008A7C76D|nr:5-oxoprolinase subunit PxpB [Rhizobium sp. NFR12]SEH31025.1 sensor histidine kinase inhibitor, KipI family [Rhizobium sp. NFR12]
MPVTTRSCPRSSSRSGPETITEISYPRILRCGDSAIGIEFSDTVSEAANLKVLSLDASLADAPIDGILETIPTYRSLTVFYDPKIVRGAALGEQLLQRAARDAAAPDTGRPLEFPVFYGGEHQADLDEIAQLKNIAEADVIALHSSAEYRVYMIGFAPGFAYLGGLPEILHTPRLAVPRQRIEAGGIGIGGRQSSINSVPGPSGWRFIGRTPFKLFDPARTEAFLLRAGDRITFRSIDMEEARDLDAQVAAGTARLRELVR